SRALTRAANAAHIAPTLQAAIERWSEVEGQLLELFSAVNAGTAKGARTLDLKDCLAPMPRAWQWLDGSAFEKHGEVMQQAFNPPPIET
ncbi:MAG TPA: fumarylacetoacetate hydrolase, partial [Hyphomonadaceae bacterium]|nr:fumarylacetoacetate hydrolase [Hyphomonadaceae bacterium]